MPPLATVTCHPTARITREGCTRTGSLRWTIYPVSIATSEIQASPGEPSTAWHALAPEAVAARLGTDLDRGLSPADVKARLEKYGANVVQREEKASVWTVALQQVRDPRNIKI